MKLEFFDPAMCCSTGICGPGVDENLVRVNENINHLKGKYPNLTVERYMISQQPLKFKENPIVLLMVKDKGNDALPITTLDGKIIKFGAYPTLEEMEAAIGDDSNGS